MDVRAKQRLCLVSCPLNSNGLSGGFAPRHLKRSVLSGLMRNNVKCAAKFLLLAFEFVVVDNFKYGLSRLHHN